MHKRLSKPRFARTKTVNDAEEYAKTAVDEIQQDRVTHPEHGITDRNRPWVYGGDVKEMVTSVGNGQLAWMKWKNVGVPRCSFATPCVGTNFCGQRYQEP